MSKLAIKLLNYLGLLDIPEEKVKHYLAKRRRSRRVEPLRKGVLRQGTPRENTKTEDKVSPAVTVR